MSKSHQLAWAAGFIDGDGFITIQDRTSKVKDKIYNGFYVRLGCCQASETPLKELQRIFGGTIREKNSGPNKEKYNRKTQYIWCLSTKQACEAIQQLLPYLVHKKEVAQLALEFQSTMGNHYQVPEETKLYRTLLKEKIQTINSLS
jgi:hypothetical protein